MIPRPAAAWHPERDVVLVAGTPAGGGQDRPARALIAVLESMRLLDVPVRLVNMPGKGGGSAWDHVRARSGDAHVLGISSPPLLTNRILGVSDYDHAALTPIAMLYSEYVAFVVPKDSPLTSTADLQRSLATDPGSIVVSLATALGTTNHIALAAIARHAGADPRRLRIKVFDSARYAVADVLAGNADAAAVSAVSAAPELAGGSLRTLAVTAPVRLPGIFADAPTLSELGIDCVMGTWRGVIAPPGVTSGQCEFWNATLAAATHHPEWDAELARQYWVGAYLNAAECATFMDRERTRLQQALAELGSA
jgi:putative tricarboxylic transport membrane protein